MICKLCAEEVEELYSVTINGKRKRACEECVDRLREEGEITDAALEAMQGMMDYKGKW
ncbi:MAG: hypothetical protein IPJ88_14040 [Myxococcales bacterium]|nr:MAG: hypothetical protein IPJ88_14040 [Myxococcales bacterium]